MKHMFAGDPWYNGQGEQGGVQKMGFRPGPVQVGMLKPMQTAAPTFGQVQMTNPLQQQPSLLAQPASQQQQPQASVSAPGGQKRVPMGSKADCPVCGNFGGRR